MSDPTTPDSSSSGTESGVANNMQATRMQTVVAVGVLISAPVYWTFTQFLAINLPGLTQTGWL